MTCQYPNCQRPAFYLPVVELPTLRSAGDGQAMIESSRPTVLMCQAVCPDHMRSYNLADWIAPGDWTALQDLAHQNGYFIPDPQLVAVQFKPLGWMPRRTFELERP